MNFDLVDFYHNESRLFGVDTLKRDLTASAEVLDGLIPGFVAGDHNAAPIAETCGLSEAQEAYRKVAAGAAGRIVCGHRNRRRL
ncbi:MAG: hypothetical protein WCF81_20370 [Roseiarcus sp.]